MGKTSSKSAVTHNADPQIRIINQQNLHSEQLDHHEVLLYAVLFVTMVQLVITLYVLQQKREKRRAYKLAKSLQNVAEV